MADNLQKAMAKSIAADLMRREGRLLGLPPGQTVQKEFDTVRPGCTVTISLPIASDIVGTETQWFRLTVTLESDECTAEGLEAKILEEIEKGLEPIEGEAEKAIRELRSGWPISQESRQFIIDRLEGKR